MITITILNNHITYILGFAQQNNPLTSLIKNPNMKKSTSILGHNFDGGKESITQRKNTFINNSKQDKEEDTITDYSNIRQDLRAERQSVEWQLDVLENDYLLPPIDHMCGVFPMSFQKFGLVQLTQQIHRLHSLLR